MISLLPAISLTGIMLKKLIKFHCGKNKYKLDNGGQDSRAVADDLIYNSGSYF